MNSMNVSPAQGQSKKNSVDRIIVAGAVVLVAMGLILGAGRLIDSRTDRAQIAAATAAASFYVSPELKALDYAPVAEAEGSLFVDQDVRRLQYAPFEAPEASLSENPELKAMTYAPVAEGTSSAVDILRPFSDNR